MMVWQVDYGKQSMKIEFKRYAFERVKSIFNDQSWSLLLFL